MKGRRRDDCRLGELPDDVQPGDIWRYTCGPVGEEAPVSAKGMYGDRAAGNLTDGVWGYASPDGNGIGTLGLHTVRENDDGTVTVAPGDGSSNSILHSGGPTNQTWHGYIDHDFWQAC